MEKKNKLIEAESEPCDLSGEKNVVPGPALVESKDKEGSVWEVVLIRSGLSDNRNLYPPDVLQKAAPLFEGVRALARSDEDHLQDKKKNVKDIVGWFGNVRFVEGNLLAEFYVSKTADWLKVMLKDAWERGKKDLVGLSIVAEGTGMLKKTASGLVRHVQTIDRVNSVDVIFNPAAGGGFLRLVAAEGEINNGLTPQPKERSMDKLLEALKKKAPGVFAKIDPGKITQEELKGLLAEAEAEAPPAPGSGVTPPQPAASNQQTPAPATPAAGPAALLEAQAAEGARLLDDIKRRNCGLMLTEALTGSDLPKPVQEQVRTRFKDKIFEASELQAEIVLQKDTLAKLTEAGNVHGVGGSRVEGGADEKEKALKALDGYFATGDLDGVPRFSSLTEAYVYITGDTDMRGRFTDAKNLHRFVEALDTSSWAEILGDSITRRMQAEYNVPGLDDWKKVVSVVSNITDFRTQRRPRMGGYTTLPAVSESGTYQELSSPGDEEATFAISKRGGLEILTLEMIKNDDKVSIPQIPRKLARAAARTLYNFVFGFIKDNSTCTYDSKALFHADHGNLGSAALSATSLMAAKIAMADQTAYGNSSEVLGLIPKYLLVPSELEDTGERLVKSKYSIGSAEGTPRYTDTEPNIHSTYGLELILMPAWDDADDWALVSNPADCPTIEIGFEDGREEPELFAQDQPSSGSLFTADKITYKIKHVYGGAILDHRGMYKAVV